MVSKNTKYILRVANPRAADRPVGGMPPEGRIVMTRQRPLNYYLLSVCLIMAPPTADDVMLRNFDPASASQNEDLSLSESDDEQNYVVLSQCASGELPGAQGRTRTSTRSVSFVWMNWMFSFACLKSYFQSNFC
jgi:hypothetical protein